MGYDRGDSFPFDFEPNGNPFGSKSKGKLSLRSYPIQFERKWNTSFLSAHLAMLDLEQLKESHDFLVIRRPNWENPIYLNPLVNHCAGCLEFILN